MLLAFMYVRNRVERRGKEQNRVKKGGMGSSTENGEVAERMERSRKRVCTTCVCTVAFPLWKAVWNGKRNCRSQKFVAFLFARTVCIPPPLFGHVCPSKRTPITSSCTVHALWSKGIVALATKMA